MALNLAPFGRWTALSPTSIGAIMKGLIAFALATLISVSHAVPLQCPDGAKVKTKSLEEHGVLVEWCEDKNGLKNGPLRYMRQGDGSVEADYSYRAGKKHGVSHMYYEDGTLEMELLYENGEEVRSRFSTEGLRRIIEQRNDVARESGKRWQIVLVDEHTLEYDVTLDVPSTGFPSEQKDIAGELASRSEVCALFKIPGTGFESVRARYISNDGKLLAEAIVGRSVCIRANQSMKPTPGAK
jgi:hypothetical protein